MPKYLYGITILIWLLAGGVNPFQLTGVSSRVSSPSTGGIFAGNGIEARLQAQSSGSAVLTRPQIEAFPKVDAYLGVWDEQGLFIHGLQAIDVRMQENEVSLSVDEIQETRPGVQVVVAINPGQTFSTRTKRGLTRGEVLLGVIQKWAISRIGSDLDDWSLLVANGTEASHLSKPDEWLSALDKTALSTQAVSPNLEILSRAIDIAADPTVRSGMSKVLIFITSPIEQPLSIPVDNFIARAKQQGVRIFVWMVASPGAFGLQSTNQISKLATETNGQFIPFTGVDPLPDLENYLESLRNIYRLKYTSQVKAAGTQSVVAQINTPAGIIAAPAQTFDINIQPPEPIFVSPPLEIRRKSSLALTDIAGALTADSFLPTLQELQIVISFPDERVRPLVRSALFVDGQLVVENNEPPFEQFTWPLVGYTSSGSHALRIEVEDSLGLVGASTDTLVQVAIEFPKPDPWAWIYRNIPVLSGLVVVLAGAVLALVLVLGGRLKPHTARKARSPSRKSDPVTQPVPVKSEPANRRLPGWVNRLHWPQRHITPQAYAFLSRLSESDELALKTPIPITTDEITFGSDPGQATLVITDPSVENLHARLARQEDGSFRLADQGSVAGTWINYTPVSQEGATLEHGDLLHIGRVGFRFTLQKPPFVEKPVATPIAPDQEIKA